MPPMVEDDWSDSEDDGSVSEVETSVLLGVPDGNIQETSDLSDPSVSRIGGLPAFLPTHPLSPSSWQCTICGRQMPLLVQMWCPFEGSAMDRALYVWGCERPACQHKDGSIRVWRGLKFNPTYAAKLAKKQVREAQKLSRQAVEEARDNTEKKNRTINPFSFSTDMSTNVFGLGTHLFGSNASPPSNDAIVGEEDMATAGSNSEDEAQSGGGLDVVTEKVASVTLESSGLSPDWSSCPAYKPVYLSTISEYLLSTPKSQTKAESFLGDDVDDNKAGKDWGLEGWEKAGDVDGVFEKFVKRVSSENKQCIRYDLKGTPLPFGSRDKLYGRLWPPPPPPSFTTKPGFAAPIIQQRGYDASTIDRCGACGHPRVFECQLMPNLINVLLSQGKVTEEPRKNGDMQKLSQTEEERKQRDLEVRLNAGMEWGTCFIYSCERDCCEEEEGWREELGLVQWDE